MRLGALVLLALVTMACGGRTDESRRTRMQGPPPRASEAVPDSDLVSTRPLPGATNLGLLVSLSGEHALAGSRASRAAQLAIAQLNGLGGLRGKRLHLVLRDDQSEPGGSTRRARELRALGVRVVVGPTNHDGASRVSDLVRRSELLFVSPASATLRSTDVVPPPFAPTLLYRTRVGPAPLAAAITRFATDSARCEDLVIVTGGGELPLAEALAGTATAAGLGEVPVVSGADVDPRRAAAEVASFASASTRACQAVLGDAEIVAAYAEAFREAIPVGLSPVDVPTFVSGAAALAAEIDTAALAGFHVVRPYHEGPAYDALRKAWAAAYPGEEPPDYEAAATYDAALLLASAVARAGTDTDLAAIAASLGLQQSGDTVGPYDLAGFVRAVEGDATFDYEGASGPVDFRPTGEVLVPIQVAEVDAQRALVPVTLYPADDLLLEP